MLPGNTMSESSVRESVYGVLSEGKERMDGTSYDPIAKGVVNLPSSTAPTEGGRSLTVRTVDGEEVPVMQLSGRKWTEIIMLLQCGYIQNKCAGISKCITSVVVENKPKERMMLPLPPPKKSKFC